MSLRFTTDDYGQPLGQARNEPFGEPIFDKAKVEERIRRAQRAILNPSTRPREFLEGDDEDPMERQLTFSTNCVSLEISGSDVADLSFCDLPGLFLLMWVVLYSLTPVTLGLIASVGKGGNAGDIDLVRNLVTSYISKPSCIILLTVACESE